MKTYRLAIDKHLRKTGMSNAELARRLGMSSGNLSMLKTRDTVSLKTVAKLIDIFELDHMEELFEEIHIK
ncbi:helix-turn-helix transcriptional regulator [Priestia aryabhattai]|uniref:helix-turn-helix domain-containing protein n=1 Tax=Priestia aryabhattai TaxID=412384 RepID=UPI00203D1B09|nr:helix-turn-helix domain-containing protein [Priestia aryabhattai]MCM3641404.1 helix-turn-helix transcriptional regulator [Priestia aryabhattai]